MAQLSEYLDEVGESVVAFAERLGVAPSTIYRIRNREVDCTAEMARRIMEATGGRVTPNDLILPPAEAA